MRLGEDAAEAGAARASRPSKASPIERGRGAALFDDAAAELLADSAATGFDGFG